MAATSADIVSIVNGLEKVVPFDADIFGSGTLAERPVSGSGEGDLYLVKDVASGVYRIDFWDGTVWRPLSAGGFFGANFEFARDDGTDSTTSTTFQEKLTFTTNNLDPGFYFALFSFSLNASTNNREVEYRIQLDDTTDIFLGTHITLKADNFVPFAIGEVLEFTTSGTRQFDIDYRRQGNSTTVRIKDASVIFWQLS